MIDYNHSGLSVEAIRSRRHLGTFRNNWRKRVVEVYALPEDFPFVFTIGTAFDGSERVIVREPQDAYQRRIDYNDWTDYN